MGKLEWGSVLGVAGEELEGRNQILTFAKKVDVQFFRRESVREESDYALSLLFFRVIILRANLLRQYRGGISEFVFFFTG